VSRRRAATNSGRHAGRAPRLPFAVLVISLVVGGLGLLLLLNTASAANELRRHDFAVRDDSVAAQVQELQNEVAASGAPSNLARAAAALGMVPAGNPAFLVIGPDGTVRVLGSPAPVSVIPVVTAAAPHPTPTKKATAKSTPSSSKTGTASKTSAVKSSTPSPKPTPTPTPTLTLGGNR
jgi:hypothetical protein